MQRNSTPTINTEPADSPELLTVEEARQRLRISTWSINRLIQRRQLATLRIGRRRLVPARALNDLVEQLSQEEAA